MSELFVTVWWYPHISPIFESVVYWWCPHISPIFESVVVSSHISYISDRVCKCGMSKRFLTVYSGVLTYLLFIRLAYR